MTDSLHSPGVTISRHKERLQPALDIQKRARKVKTDTEAMEALLIDCFRLMEDLGIDVNCELKRAIEQHELEKRHAQV